MSCFPYTGRISQPSSRISHPVTCWHCITLYEIFAYYLLLKFQSWFVTQVSSCELSTTGCCYLECGIPELFSSTHVYYFMCPHTTVSSYYYICVLMLCVCPHTAVYVCAHSGRDIECEHCCFGQQTYVCLPALFQTNLDKFPHGHAGSFNSF